VRRAYPAVSGLAALLAAAVLVPGAASAKPRHQVQHTILVSRALDGGSPNGPSTNAVISNDRRWARIVAFESDASNLVRKDTNGFKDVFIVRRKGSFHNNGSKWEPGRTALISRGPGGPANGPSYAPAVSGGFWTVPSCVAFLSTASNLVAGDTNGTADAFVSRGPGGLPARLTLPGGAQPTADVTQVAVSGDCTRIAFVSGGRLYVRAGKKVRQAKASGPVSELSFSNGFTNDLVFTGKRGVYLSRGGTKRPHLVGPGGRNGVYNDIHKPSPRCKHRTVAYEKKRGGHWQIYARRLGGRMRIVSQRRGRLANGDSRDPVIGNAGCYVTFESDATNLGLNATRRTGDNNRLPDVYLYTAVRRITLVQSVKDKAIPLATGGRKPSMSFYANYILFDSVAPLRNQVPLTPWQEHALRESQYSDPLPVPTPAAVPPKENRQIYLRYLGPV
jgi:hypothetical protein